MLQWSLQLSIQREPNAKSLPNKYILIHTNKYDAIKVLKSHICLIHYQFFSNWIIQCTMGSEAKLCIHEISLNWSPQYFLLPIFRKPLCIHIRHPLWENQYLLYERQVPFYTMHVSPLNLNVIHISRSLKTYYSNYAGDISTSWSERSLRAPPNRIHPTSDLGMFTFHRWIIFRIFLIF